MTDCGIVIDWISMHPWKKCSGRKEILSGNEYVWILFDGYSGKLSLIENERRWYSIQKNWNRYESFWTMVNDSVDFNLCLLKIEIFRFLPIIVLKMIFSDCSFQEKKIVYWVKSVETCSSRFKITAKAHDSSDCSFQKWRNEQSHLRKIFLQQLPTIMKIVADIQILYTMTFIKMMKEKW